MLQKKRKKKQQQQQPGLMMRDELAMKTKEGSAFTRRFFASFFEGLGFFLLLKSSQITTANTTYRVTRLCCCNAERKLGLQAKHGLHAAANSGGGVIDTQTLALIWIKPSFFLFEDNARMGAVSESCAEAVKEPNHPCECSSSSSLLSAYSKSSNVG
jgi:hypothetical protein